MISNKFTRKEGKEGGGGGVVPAPSTISVVKSALKCNQCCHALSLLKLKAGSPKLSTLR